MTRYGAGKVDLSVLASLLAALASLAAVVTVGLVAWQVREDSRITRVSARVEVLWHVNDQWKSAAMGDVRSAAAAALLGGKANSEVGAVLDFFEQMALLLNRGVLDEELAARSFYWPLANYWTACSAYVQQVQRDDPSAWGTISGLVQRLGAIEAQRKRRETTEVVPSAEQVQRFLLDEQGNNECTDDTDAEKTPA